MLRSLACPSCQSESSFDASSLPQTVECPCGALMHAVASESDQSGLAVTAVCGSCQSGYEVDSTLAGQAFDCQCGNIVVTPMIAVAREAVAAATPFALSASEQPASHPETSATTESEAPADDVEKPARKLPWFHITMGTMVAGLMTFAIVNFAISGRETEPVAQTLDLKAETTNEQRYGSLSDTAVEPVSPETSGETSGAGDSSAASGPPGEGDDTSTSRTAAAGSIDVAKRSVKPKPPVQAPLPKAVPARPFVEVTPIRDRALTFTATYDRAYDAYERALEAQQEIDPGLPETVTDYQEALSTAIGWMQICLKRVPDKLVPPPEAKPELETKKATDDQPKKPSGGKPKKKPEKKATPEPSAPSPKPPTAAQRRNEIRYMLAYLNYLAGRLPEAAIFGQTVARWGDLDDPSTRESAMIALAALQEANSSHWGDARQVGELDQMVSVAALIEKRWPKDPQRDVINLSVAQSYESFGHPDKAIQLYTRVRKSSKDYLSARLSAARLTWKDYQTLASKASGSSDGLSATENARMGAALKQANAWFTESADLLKLNVAKTKPGPDRDASIKSLVTTKITLARISLLQRRAPSVIKWLSEPPAAPLKSIAIKGLPKPTSGYTLPTDHAALVYETLAKAHAIQGAKSKQLETLKLLAELSPKYAARVSQEAWASLTKLANQVRSKDTVGKAEVNQVELLASPLSLADPSVPISQVFWYAGFWKDLADRAQPKSLANQARVKAIEAYEEAMSRGDFSSKMAPTIKLRIAALQSESGDHEKALEALGEILAKSPNAIDQQYEAAETLYRIAQQSSTNGGDTYAAAKSAMSGRQGTAIWGWYRLAAAVYSIRHSDSGTDKHIDQLRWAQLRIAQCQHLMRTSTNDAAEEQQLKSDLKKQLTKLESELDTAPESWGTQYQAQLSAAK